MADFLYAPTRPERLAGVRVRPFHVAIVAVGLLVGGAAAVQPGLAIAAVLALALLPLVLAKPFVGFAALLFFSFLESYGALPGALSLTKILGGILVLAWLAFVATRSRAERHARGLLSRQPFLAAALALFVAWAAMSLVWAEDPTVAQGSVMRFALNFVLFPIALVAVRSRGHVLWLVAIFTAAAFTTVAFGLAEGKVSDPEAEGRLGGAGINPNQLGSYLVVAAIFMAVLVANRRWSAVTRAGLLAIAGLAAVSVFLTVSRGALVGLGAALLLTPFVIGRGRRTGAVLLAAVAALGTFGWFATFATADAAERVLHPERVGASGREDVWRVGWRMVEDEPLHGIGAGNFPVSAVHYLLRPGITERDEIIVDEQKVAHNIYLTVLAELGAVGLALFLFILLESFRSALRAARAFAERGDRVMELVTRGWFIALVSMAVVGFFSSALYSKQFWLLVATTPALLALAERADGTTRPAAPARLRLRPVGGRAAA
jgi:putative inorganic carbon (HCO3(-)) transporter